MYVCCWNSSSKGVNCGSDTRRSDICECDMGGKVTKWVSLGGVKFVAVIVDGVPLVDSDEAMLVEVWPCVAGVVGVVDGLLVVGSVVIRTYIHVIAMY